MNVKGKVLLRPLEAMGYTPESFQISNPDNEGRVFTYYTFDEGYRPELLDVWEIVGVHQRSNDPPLLDIRLMHLEVEDMEKFAEGEFVALQHAPSYLSLNPTEVRALIEFFEAIDEGQLEHLQSAFTRFRLLTIDELAYFHLRSSSFTDWESRCYRYLPEDGIQSAQEISVFIFPRWSSKYAENQRATLSLLSFRQQKLEDPTFKPFDTFGVSTVTFDQRALEEFITLLKQRTYENFVGASQT
jgi:hypothetical protein